MATRISFKTSVTFEFPEAAPLTRKVEIIAGTAQKAASDAYKQARRAFPKVRPCSIVIVLEVGERTHVALKPGATFPKRKAS